ncbi:MAG: hypothetical protein AABX98_06430 [Nanoarchaeota archaeon]
MGIKGRLLVGGGVVLGAISLGSGIAQYGIPTAKSSITSHFERSQYEHDLFDKVITHADTDNNGVLELTEASIMLRVMGHPPRTFYEGQGLSVTYDADEKTSVQSGNVRNNSYVSINLNVSDLEKYAQEKMPMRLIEKSM